eukprot:TRINITY_DN10577_c0_g1_i4.p1 TRINITY_DN10577_c0_g1~~TRINITY_DN10577_c0_g1_i4.p1  ORF type:complete len:148 (-),score=29.19 TRINITY_DN10577_c0_g1_i4:244-687(-)
MAILVTLNVLVLMVIYHGSATLFFVASGVSIPLTSLLSALPFLGTARVQFFWYDFLLITCTLVGLLLYRARPEEIELLDEEEVSDDQLQQIGASPDHRSIDSDLVMPYPVSSRFYALSDDEDDRSAPWLPPPPQLGSPHTPRTSSGF